jgi:tRNA G18 (ribose-2'-O)-methylase SpoU
VRTVDAGSLLLPERRERVDEVVAGRTRSLTVVLEEIHDPHNIAAVLRTCECFGIQDLHVVEGPDTPYVPAPLVTQGAEKWVDVATPCRLNAGSHAHSIAAMTTGKYSARHPAITALIAAFSTVTRP